jgi:hypothetical protein
MGGAAAAAFGSVGPYYTGMITYVHDVLDNLGSESPEADPAAAC